MGLVGSDSEQKSGGVRGLVLQFSLLFPPPSCPTLHAHIFQKVRRLPPMMTMLEIQQESWLECRTTTSTATIGSVDLLCVILEAGMIQLTCLSSVSHRSGGLRLGNQIDLRTMMAVLLWNEAAFARWVAGRRVESGSRDVIERCPA